ncbi:MAG: hypothetical protein KAT90_13800 [Gammaproteobacteria bacterium]|nr:hypothetical protein [Gammaproteobacteria bacterium]
MFKGLFLPVKFICHTEQELASGLALLSGLPNNTRGIPTKITTDYCKKAPCKLVAEPDFL